MENSKLVPMVIVIAFIYTFCMIPISVLSKGYLPNDDALRHVAKVISGKNWDEILVLRPEIRTDSHPGWHRILETVYRMTGTNARGLLMLSVAMLFIWFSIVPLLFLERPEAWGISILIIAMSSWETFLRLFLGRPLIFTMSWIIFLYFIWEKLRHKHVPRGIWVSLLLYSAAATWIHCNWVVFVLPVFCFLLAREWRAAMNLMLIILIAIPLGACFTGHPFLFLRQTFLHGYLALSKFPSQSMLVTEFQSGSGMTTLVIAVILIIFGRILRNDWNPKIIDNPIFIFALLCYTLQFVMARFWLDLGFPALSVWIAIEFQDLLKKKTDLTAWKRAGLALFILMMLYLSVSNNHRDRWSVGIDNEFLSYEKSEDRKWLPEDGGIIYNMDMITFYKTFYKNPDAPWRYILGFEPTMMPDEDFEIYKNILLSKEMSAFDPWIGKMSGKDRVVIIGAKAMSPAIPGLEWHYMADNIWIGKKSNK